DIRDDPRFAQLLKLEKDLTLNIDGGWSFNWSWGGKHGLFSLNSDKRHAQKVADWKEELPRIEQAAKDHPKSGRAQYNVGYARLMVDDPKGAEDAFKKALELGHRKPTTLYNLACAAARQDAKDRAFDYLSKSIDAGFDAAGQMENDDDLDSLRDDPRFRKLVRKAEAVADDQDD
ncbi:MAG: hypothetical protein JST92_25990, partial [Deltaproteobacteria bacterium]|nr:hypothetical protein [Deltaproteobacteria bacterium]